MPFLKTAKTVKNVAPKGSDLVEFSEPSPEIAELADEIERIKIDVPAPKSRAKVRPEIEDDPLNLVEAVFERLKSYDPFADFEKADPEDSNKPEVAQPEPQIESNSEVAEHEAQIESTPEIEQPEAQIESTPEIAEPEPEIESTPEIEQTEPQIESNFEVAEPEPEIESTPEIEQAEAQIESNSEVAEPEAQVESTPEIEQPETQKESTNNNEGSLELKYDVTSGERYVDAISTKTQFEKMLDELGLISKDLLEWQVEKFAVQFANKFGDGDEKNTPETAKAKKFGAFLGGFITNAAMILQEKGYRDIALDCLEKTINILKAQQKLEAELLELKQLEEEENYNVDLSEILVLFGDG